MNCPICNAILLVGTVFLRDGVCTKNSQCGICKTIFRVEIKILRETELTKEQIALKLNKSTYSTYDEQQHVIPYPVKKGK